MAVFKCKLCGGTIEPKEEGIGICDSCGTKQTIASTNDEKKMNLLDRANHFRMTNDFDKAMGIYEQVLEEDTTDSDVYFSIALCRYGITYVDDPKTNKKIPTINRMQSKLFSKDPDYLMAIKNASSEQQILYIETSEYIDKIQQDIMDITKNEKPYDVFICYKETDDSGKRTHDSVLANDLYHELTEEGFKVFFARITLEGKLGTAYEPYIFSALNSSKVMVVIGTKKEYFNAVWVKNEWSRFLALINSGEKKILIPAFKDMDPYDLPEEFANLQAQDMSKLGFMQDIIRGIRKLTNKALESTETTKNTGSGADDVNSLLRRIEILLEDGDFEKADEYCEKVLDKDPENSKVYFYKFLVEEKLRNIKQFKTTYRIDFEKSTNYQKAKKFADDDMKNMLNEPVYERASQLEEKHQMSEAISFYRCILDFKDSKERIEVCQQKIYELIYEKAIRCLNDSNYEGALNSFNKLKGTSYKDSDVKCKEFIDKLNNEIYAKAIKEMEENGYASALCLFSSIEDYKDSYEKLIECKEKSNDEIYAKAIKEMEENRYHEAVQLFSNIKDYKDSHEKLVECQSKINKKVAFKSNVGCIGALIVCSAPIVFVYSVICMIQGNHYDSNFAFVLSIVLFVVGIFVGAVSK